MSSNQSFFSMYTQYNVRSICRLLRFVVLTSTLVASAQTSLVDRSPFSPPVLQSNGTEPAPIVKTKFPEVQFVGYSGKASSWSFALFFNPQNQVKWLPLGAAFLEVKVIQFDPKIPSLTLEHAGQQKTIKLAQSAPASTHIPRPAITLPGQTTSKKKHIPRRRIILTPKSSN